MMHPLDPFYVDPVMDLNVCPSCGEEVEVGLVGVPSRIGSYSSSTPDSKTFFVHCAHCNMQGSHFVAEQIVAEEVVDAQWEASRAWNALRPAKKSLRDQLHRWLSRYIPHDWIPF